MDDLNRARESNDSLVCSALGIIQLRVTRSSWLTQLDDTKVISIINEELSSLRHRKSNSVEQGERMILEDRINHLTNYLL